jgi:DNA-binding PadR family transcriptional regulator
MGTTLRLSTQTLQVLDALLTAPRQWRYGYDLSRDTGLKSGTLYPILMRLSERSLMETRWEQSSEGRPPRHMYRLTPEGARVARDLRTSPSARALRPALGES